MLISVVLTTYNSVRPLAATLRSFKGQTDHDFEVVIADDGSTHETADLIASFKREVGYALSHVWQEDEGFRAVRVRNLAISQSTGEYVVFVDGDCFVLPDFIATHRRLSERGYFVSGKRCWLREGFSRHWLNNPSDDGRVVWLVRALLNKCTRPLELIPRHDGGWRYRRFQDWRGVQTCNLGVWRDDLLAVNGFNNRYFGPKWEDSDLVVRLIRNNTLRKLGDHGSPVLHLWHERRSIPPDSPNERLFQEMLRSDQFWSEDGLDNLSSAGFSGPPSRGRHEKTHDRPRHGSQ